MNDDFERFWKAYPKKESKGDARKAWSKVRVPIDEILAAVELFKKTKRGGGDRQYIPYPATWLRAERWSDEFTEKDMLSYVETNAITFDQMRMHDVRLPIVRRADPLPKDEFDESRGAMLSALGKFRGRAH